MNENLQISVLLVEDDGPIDRAFRQALAEDKRFRYIGNALGRKNFIAYAKEHDPDVIVIDLFLPATGPLLSPLERKPSQDEGFWHISRARELCPNSRIIALSNYFLINPEYARQALERGADAYLPKHNAPQDEQDWGEWLTHNIWIVYRGNWKPDSTLEAGLNASQFKPTDLSEREVEILRMLSQDKSDLEVGAALFISHNTVRSHIKNILDKMHAIGIRDRRELIEWAHRKGVI